jgi:hypothetical protein
MSCAPEAELILNSLASAWALVSTPKTSTPESLPRVAIPLVTTKYGSFILIPETVLFPYFSSSFPGIDIP